LAALPLLLWGAPRVAQVAQPAPATPPAEPDELVVDVVGGISAPMPIAIPYMPTPSSVQTAAGETGDLGRKVAEIVASDLRNSGLFTPRGPSGLPGVAYPEVSAPNFPLWSGTGAQALVQGYVQANADGNLTVGCYLYDVFAKTELTRQGYVVPPALWRRAAHKCADAIYARLTGESGYFDSRVVYVAERGPKGRRVKQLAIMDQDGANHRFLTNGQTTVLTPRFSPNQQTIVYMSYVNDQPRVYVYDVGSGQQRLLVNEPHMTFAPRFSPDGRFVVFSMAVAGNTDIYRVPTSGGRPGAAHRYARHRYRRKLFAGRAPDRVRKRSRRIAAALRHERRRIEPAKDQLRLRPICHPRLEPARRSHRFHQARRRRLPDRRHGA
jgi:TolB protein